MRDVVALWYVGHRTAADLVYSACDLLLAGLDGPALRELAAVSIDQAEIEVPDLLEAALQDVGLPYHTNANSVAAQQAGLTAVARQTLSDALTPRDLAAWAHATFGHQVEFAASLAEFDDIYDTVEYTDTTREEVDAQVIAEARRIVDSTLDESP
jgi:hypothetical protein